MKKSILIATISLLSIGLYSQNVGIGTPSPVEKLEVNGGIRIGYSSNDFNGGTLRFNNNEIEYNNGFGWRTLVNSFKDSSLSSLTPFSTTLRNTWIEVPNVSMTVSEQGVYLIVYKVNGYNNSVYFPGSGNADQAGSAYFSLNGGSLAQRTFIMPEESYTGTSGRRDFLSNPVEYTTIQNLFPGNQMKIYVRMSATGSTPNSWTVNEAQIMLIRLY
jgi:hypothetical protein